jgi:hypothetical protein
MGEQTAMIEILGGLVIGKIQQPGGPACYIFGNGSTHAPSLCGGDKKERMARAD